MTSPMERDSSSARPWGLTAAICTHNGSGRLPGALTRLALQSVAHGTQWEVLVVDNQSSDDTRERALATWDELGAPTSLRVVPEPTLGLSFARERAFREAAFACVSLIDDDNLVDRNWVAVALAALGGEPRIGAVGGRSTLLSDGPVPLWFESVSRLYAVGDLGETPRILGRHEVLWGAGLTVRVDAWSRLLRSGFRAALTDRRGEHLSSGGDTELCLALQKAGWLLLYDPRLNFQHAIGVRRLTKGYLLRLAEGCGRSAPLLDGFYLDSMLSGMCSRAIRRSWIFQVLLAFTKLMHRPLTAMSPTFFPPKDIVAAVANQMWRGRMLEVFRIRRKYTRRIEELEAYDWGSARPERGGVGNS